MEDLNIVKGMKSVRRLEKNEEKRIFEEGLKKVEAIDKVLIRISTITIRWMITVFLGVVGWNITIISRNSDKDIATIIEECAKMVNFSHPVFINVYLAFGAFFLTIYFAFLDLKTNLKIFFRKNCTYHEKMISIRKNSNLLNLLFLSGFFFLIFVIFSFLIQDKIFLYSMEIVLIFAISTFIFLDRKNKR